ncbi:MAG TPA: sigma-70 family RNA polymerase sigma factor [Acidimicrobiales bacterium]|jgi:RNA polymerase sigma-B factor|nr:sigma-70 family RNA polymerase sigma factor [Acidimicrobiales bacterium]
MRVRAATSLPRLLPEPAILIRDLHLAAASDLSSSEAAALVDRYGGLARSLALRMARSQHEVDDLVQVAMFGLLQALRRFDPDRGFEFSTFAHATISGELKRYRRRTGWSMRVPRRLQEGYLRMAAASEELSRELHREPTVGELAERASVTIEEALELLELRDAQRVLSLDAPVADDDGGAREVASTDEGFGAIELSDLVADLLDHLGEREREIVRMRFFENRTQREIADAIGLSQMHVSRLLRSSLEKLRAFAAV